MLRQSPKLIHNLNGVNLQFIRTARQLPNTKRPQRSQTERLSTPNEVEKELSSQIKPHISQNLIKLTNDTVDTSPESILLDRLNRSIPNSPTDLRYQQEKIKQYELLDEDLKLKSMAEFLLEEVKNELVLEMNGLTNPDEQQVKEMPIEDLIEYGFRTEILNNKEKSSLNMKFKSLLNILENLLEVEGGILKLSPEFYVEIFQISQYLNQQDLKLRGRFISGSLIYRLKKFEMDVISESQYIEALIEFGRYKEADYLLLKRSEKLNQRWWFELMIVNYIEIGNLNKAEQIVKIIEDRFGEYFDSRIYQLFLNRYIGSKNKNMCLIWVKKYQKLINELGFNKKNNVKSLGFDLSEEEGLEYLNSKEQPQRKDYLNLIELFLKSDYELYGISELLIDFYLNQLPISRSIKDIESLILNLKIDYSRLNPILQNLSQNHNINHLIDQLESYKRSNPIKTKQIEFLNNKLGSIINKSKRRKKLKKLVYEINSQYNNNNNNNNNKNHQIDSKVLYDLIEGLLETNQIEQAFEFLEMMERSLKINQSGDLILINQLILPSVETKHYLPFLKKYGQLGDYEQFSKVLIRYNEIIGDYNSILLTRVISSLTKMKKYDVLLYYLNEILMNDLHKSSITQDYSKLYSIIWASLKDMTRLLTRSSFDNKELVDKFPDLKFTFMKMIHDRNIPSGKDYHNIISCYLYNNDRESVICVLQYLGKVHNVDLLPESLKLLDKYTTNYQKKDKDERDVLLKNEKQMDELKRLNLIGHSQIDPIESLFGDSNKGLNQDINNNNKLLDLETAEDSINRNLIWRFQIYKLFRLLNEIGHFNENSLREIHSKFELKYEIGDIIAQFKTG